MKAKPSPYDPDLSNKNTFDKLERETELQNLTKIVEALEPPLVLAIDSDWGTGKTTFIKMWNESLKQSEFPTLFFNAWENDFVDDPLIAFIAEMNSGIENLLKETKDSDDSKKKMIQDALEEATQKGKEISKKLRPILFRSLINLATNWTVGEQGGKELGELFSGITEEVTKDWVKDYEENKESIKEFREKLEELITTLKNIQTENTHKPLIFFIDELDRCRPTYAIQLLERIKHFFNVNGIVFILAVDRKQLGHSIRGVYGSGMNVDGYLRRFIDLEYRLKKPNAKTYIAHLFEELGLQKALLNYFQPLGASSQFNDIKTILGELSEAFDLSLREQEQLCSRLNIIFRTIPKNEYFKHRILLPLLALSIQDNNLYSEIRKREKPLTAVLDKINEKLEKSFSIEKHTWLCIFEAYILCVTESEEKISSRTQKWNTPSVGAGYAQPTSREEQVNKRLTEIQSTFSKEKVKEEFKYAFNQIELLEQFKWT